ncbi:hypothetical protein CCZ01_00695 [Helicobacter monodelphidis]|uniref:NADH-quinone oxidoreductase subunit G n=1 Tax=Helicobacter sp. 15-1451 TaxID=2004995 RepID=UPI000DCC4088|nr:NADH-quinone oxidoreductase subunit G [Helicobacter sp. 15-1451]RAX59289.1 hypothetical protein CCZ01_00695 [Helicobacter sp. 15-1451]
MSKITIHIDNQAIECEEGAYILQVARENNIFIPAICYLTQCSPTLACKLCMVEADGKRVYSCNAKTKNGMKIITNTEEIETERRAIMSVYDINHPLECGVCDKSGECELQNYSLMMGVSHQEYAIKDSYKKRDSWGHALYDPNLCIVCERCITACKDRVGNAYLKTIKRDADAPDKSYKETMPKDAFGVWNKMSKSLIGFVGNGSCEDCGECISVCPVGALGEDHFHYVSNAWELEKIPSSCVHCPLGCALSYEGKHGKVYRVTNDWNQNSLCGAGRYGYNMPLNESNRNPLKLQEATKAFEEADTISFTNFITNEEAYILQLLKQYRGYKLYNPTAYMFQQFLKTFKTAYHRLYDGDLKGIEQSDCIITFGTSVRHDVPILKYSINNALKMIKGATLTTFHPLKDTALTEMAKTTQHFNYKQGEEEKVACLLLQLLIPKAENSLTVNTEIESYLQAQQRINKKEKITSTTDEKGETKETKETIESYESLIATSLGLDTQQIEVFKANLTKANRITIIAGSDLYATKQHENIAKILVALECITGVQVILLPPEGNALGVALICDLDAEKGHNSIGYNKEGDYQLLSLPNSQETKTAMLMPSMWQQFGTFTTLNKEVVPLLPAFDYCGYDLSDIVANLLGTVALKYRNEKNSLEDYTALLPQKSGYRQITLQELVRLTTYHHQRGYILEQARATDSNIALDVPIDSALNHQSEGEILLYGCDPESQFSAWSYASDLLRSKDGLYLSPSYLEKLGLKEGSRIKLSNHRGCLETTLYVDKKLESEEYGALSFASYMRDEHPIFEKSSRFAVAKIEML